MLSNERMFPAPRYVPTNGIDMAVYEQGSGPPVIFLHGFPELAYSWRHQLPALAAAGFRAIAPDMRGYGQTTVPPDVGDYRITELVADITGLLDGLGVDQAVFVGHDWGALVLWHMAMVEPSRIEKLVILNIPHFPRSPVDPIAIMRQRFGPDFYIVNFQDSDEADRVFAADPRQFIDRVMRKGLLSRAQYEKLPAEQQVVSLLRIAQHEQASGQSLLTPAELDYYAEAFERSGFTGPINWYRNWTDNWKSLDGVDQAIRLPTLFIGAENDVLIRLEHIESMKPLVEDLTIRMLDCGHWTQQEMPDEVNRLIVDWLVQRG